MTDRETALEIATFLCPDSQRLEILVIPGEPRAKERPRLGRGNRTYSPDAKDEEATAWHIQQGMKIKKPFAAGVAIGCVFYRSTLRRVDGDNLQKHVWDAATKAKCVWDDDSQALIHYGRVEYDPQNPRTVIVLGDCATSMDRTPGKKARRKTRTECLTPTARKV